MCVDVFVHLKAGRVQQAAGNHQMGGSAALNSIDPDRFDCGKLEFFCTDWRFLSSLRENVFKVQARWGRISAHALFAPGDRTS